jgi:Cu-Zn family superoxide dismutase
MSITNALAAGRSSLASSVLLALLAGATTACAAIVDESGEATATLAATQGSTASGTATFKAAGKDGVQMTVAVTGLKPGAAHGFHIHEKGDCSAPDATSAGPHFALAGQQHGTPEGESFHAGDLGNITTDAGGKGTASLMLPASKLTLGPGPLSVVGRAVVVHGAPDDLKSQPAGNSGPRIACGVIDRRTVKDGIAPMKPAN